MKKLIKPASLLLCFFSVIIFFLAGMYLARIVGAGKNQGLAGGAIVLFYGLVSAVVAFIFALVMAYHISHRVIVKINWVLGIVFFILVFLFVNRIKNLDKKEEPVNDYPKKITAPAPENISLVSYSEFKEPSGVQLNSKPPNMGLGLFKPDFFEYPTLYFYGVVNLEKEIADHARMDSVVFVRDEYNNPTTSYAPPWLSPEHLKLDYGIFIFKVLGVGHDFLKVEANKQTGQISYLDKTKGDFISWPEFFLTINSVEFIEKNRQTVHVKPLEYAGEVSAKFDFMLPLLIEEDWMFVKLVNDGFAEQGKGWIRWKKDGFLLIAYSLLS